LLILGNPLPCEQSNRSEPLLAQRVYLLGSLTRTTVHIRFPQLEQHHSFEPRSIKRLGEILRLQPLAQELQQIRAPYADLVDDSHLNNSLEASPYRQQHDQHSVTSSYCSDSHKQLR
jgi:hypothetical protein